MHVRYFFQAQPAQFQSRWHTHSDSSGSQILKAFARLKQLVKPTNLHSVAVPREKLISPPGPSKKKVPVFTPADRLRRCSRWRSKSDFQLSSEPAKALENTQKQGASMWASRGNALLPPLQNLPLSSKQNRSFMEFHSGLQRVSRAWWGE